MKQESCRLLRSVSKDMAATLTKTHRMRSCCALILILLAMSVASSTPLLVQNEHTTLLIKKHTDYAKWSVEGKLREEIVLPNQAIEEAIVVSLLKNETYYFQFVNERSLAGVPLLIPTQLINADTILITLDNDSVRCSISWVDAYSSNFWNAYGKIRSMTYSTAFPDNDEVLNALNRMLRAIAVFANTTDYGEIPTLSLESRFVQMIRSCDNFIVNLLNRFQIVREQYEHDSTLDVNELKKQISKKCRQLTLRSTPGITTEAFMFNRSIVGTLATALMNWQRREALRRHLDYKLTTREIQVLEAVFGGDCNCEIAYASVNRITGDVDLLKSCQDSTVDYVRSMIQGKTGNWCDRTTNELKQVCDALNIEFINSIEGRSTDSQLVSIELDKDSIYVLHFWGTWCKPCLDQREDIARLSDSLSAIGVAVIHIDSDISSKYDKWKQMVANDKGINIMVDYDNRNPTNIINRLYVRSFPSFILVSKKGAVVERIFDYRTIMEKVRRY